MKKVQRILSGLLVLCMLLTLVPATALAARPADGGAGAKPTITRLAGEDRFKTAFAVAEELKLRLGVQKFDAIVVAYGANFPDALSGSYLAAVKKAPILLSYNEQYDSMAVDYIRKNLNPNGTVYLLGGTNVVSESFESALREFHVKRLAGENRFETNLAVLEEAGVSNKPILVCTGLSFADSLSASATEFPILLVYGDELLPNQKTFLRNLDGNDLFVIGGTSAVSETMADTLAAYGDVGRVAGANRFETSVAIARSFFPSPDSLVLAYAWNFPDGLCGGSLAAVADAPLVLTMDGWEADAAAYAAEQSASGGYILGGEKLISDRSADLILGNPSSDDSRPGDTLPEEEAREIKDKAYLPDRSADFTFLVTCDWGEEYLRENLKLTGKDGAVPYDVTLEEDGVYRIAAVEPYREYQTYYVQVAADMLFPEYNAKTLEFSIIGPDRADIEFNEDNLIFLKALELQQYGTSGMYELEWDESAQRYYLTLFELEDMESSAIGKVIAIGDYVNTEEILTDSGKELCFAKLETIDRNQDGDLLLELSVPQLSEVYDKLDIYFAASSEGMQINGDPEEAFVDAVLNSEDFAEYLASVHLAAESYAEDHGMEAMPLSEASEDNLKFELTKRSFQPTEDSDSCLLELGGKITYTIPMKSQDGQPSGSIVVSCTAEMTSTISAGGRFEDNESVDLYLTNTTTTTLGFGVEFKLEYSYEYEEKYQVHKKTGTIHTSTCRIANQSTNPDNLQQMTAEGLVESYKGDMDAMRKHECRVCLAVTGLDGTAYAYNQNTGVLHCMNCHKVKNIKDCNLYTLYPANTLEFTNCEDCRPQDRQVKDFDKRMLNAIKGSDWEEQVTAFKNMLGDSIGSKKPEPDINPQLSVPLNVLGVFNITIGVEPVFEFELKASADFSITSSTTNTYGIRNVGRGFETYHDEQPGEDGERTYRLNFTGEADAKFGINLFVIAHPVGLQKAARIEINGQIGLYGHFTGILAVEGEEGEDADAYCAARLEAGLFANLGGYWKILWFDDTFEIMEEKRVPIFKWGYDRMYYAFDEDVTERTVNGPDQIVVLTLADVMAAKYLDLTTMKYGTGVILPAAMQDIHFDITVNIQNVDGTPCDFLAYVEDCGAVIRKLDAPDYFNAIITVQLTPKVQINTLGEFFASETKEKVYGCDMDTLVVNVHVGEKDPSLDQDPILGIYKGSYFATQGETGLTLTVYREGEKYKALFDFYNLPGRTNAADGKYYMDVSYNADTGEYTFTATEWIQRPIFYDLLDLKGILEGEVLSGNSPTPFSVSKLSEDEYYQSQLGK